MKQMSRSRLFLLELLLNFLFFCLCSVICLALFARANALSQDSRALSGAVLAAENSAACFQAANGDPATLSRLLGTDAVDDVLTLSYTDTGLPATSADTAALRVTLTLAPVTGGLHTAAIAVHDAARDTADAPLYAVSVSVFDAGEVSA